VRIAALTTDTTHHRYWAWRLAEAGLLGAVVLERRRVVAPFATHHAFEDERDAFEHETLVVGIPGWGDLAPVLEVDAADDAAGRIDADLIVSFGTGRIGPAAVAAWAGRLLNLHGGDPEEYRGLDTHLWAVYHGDFDAIVTALHEVDDDLDTGAILARAPVPLPADLYALRAANTMVCVELTLAAARKRPPAIPQRRRGRYYSFMPAVLKDVCVRRWSAR
jgi:hypothetical protein